MTCIDYINYKNIIVQFDDGFDTVIKSNWDCFERNRIKDPYYPTVYGVGITGRKYPTRSKSKDNMSKEYKAWKNILQRCYSVDAKSNNPTYKDVVCCEEWLLYENFYEWLHSQENFEQWYNGDFWAVDKDIIHKGNKIYSPENCCLVPANVNGLFCKGDASRGILPIGVHKAIRSGKYAVFFSANTNGKNRNRFIGEYPTPEDAFYLGYKPYKEAYIQKIAQLEYDQGNITEKCYNAMMNYQVEITD